jgi:hypothetical protein
LIIKKGKERGTWNKKDNLKKKEKEGRNEGRRKDKSNKKQKMK